MKLPALPDPRGNRQRIQVTFRGIEDLPGAKNGAIRDMCNLRPDASGALGTRPPRVVLGDRPHNVTGLCAHGDTLYYTAWGGGEQGAAYTTCLYKKEGPDWVNVLMVYRGISEDEAKAPRYFASLGKRLIIFPDKWVYDPETGTRDDLQKADYNHAVFPENGEIAGEPALNNTIYSDHAASYATWDNVRVGDYVYVEYYDATAGHITTGPNSGKGGVIREISEDRKYLRFDEGTFVTDTTGGYIFVRRDVPDLDVLFAHDNRLWGAKGDTIYASKLGDPYNWYVFDGLSTDSWSWDTLTAGDFTGGCSYLGFPCFFKADRIFKVFGTDPRKYRAESYPDPGVAPGCGRSIAVAGEQVFYLSASGVMAFGGGHPSPVSQALGSGPWRDGAAGSDGTRYYIQMADMDGNKRLYVFDTVLGVWYREEQLHEGGDPEAQTTEADMRFCRLHGELVFYRGTQDGEEILAERRSVPPGSEDVLDGTEETNLSVYWFVEFGDITAAMQQGYGGSGNKKHIGKVLLRVSTEMAAGIDVQIRYDSRGEWQDLKSVTQSVGMTSYYLPVVPRRCDHFRLRIKGRGLYTTLHSLTLELSGGSPNKL